MAGMTLQQANAIEATVRSAAQPTIELVSPAHNIVDISVDGVTLRCSVSRGEIFVQGPFLISFFMPRPQWFDAALAGGAYESTANAAYWQREQTRRSLNTAAERNPEGIEADAADRF